MNIFSFFKSKRGNIKIRYSKGKYYIDTISIESELYDVYNECKQLINYFYNLGYNSNRILSYIQRYFAEILDIDVITEIDTTKLIWFDVDGEDLYEDDKVYVVSISIQGPIIKEFTGLQYYKALKEIELLMKLDIVLYASKNQDKCLERCSSYLELWRTIKNN